MSLERGSFSFRIFKLKAPLPHNILNAFEMHSMPPLNTVSEEPVVGWVGGRHLMDIPISEENAYTAGYLKMTLLTAQKKIPPSLLKAQCKMEELMVLKETNKPFLSRTERSEIKQDVSTRLLEQMPVSLRGISFVLVESANVIYADCISLLATDLFKTFFIKTTQETPIMITPEVLAAEVAKVNVQHWQPVCFSPQKGASATSVFVGREFLMWLWFYSEVRTGIFKTEKSGEIGIMLNGPIVTAGERGIEEIILRGTSSLHAPEIKASLLSGKTIKRANIIIALPNKIRFTFTLDADTFVIKSFKIEGEEIKAKNLEEQFHNRIEFLETFRHIFYELFEKFVKERNNKSNWHELVANIQEWITKMN